MVISSRQNWDGSVDLLTCDSAIDLFITKTR